MKIIKYIFYIYIDSSYKVIIIICNCCIFFIFYLGVRDHFYYLSLSRSGEEIVWGTLFYTIINKIVYKYYSNKKSTKIYFKI